MSVVSFLRFIVNDIDIISQRIVRRVVMQWRGEIPIRAIDYGRIEPVLGFACEDGFRCYSNPNEIRPVFFTQDIGGRFHKADPQPMIDWSRSHPDSVTSNVMIDQLKFLLSQAPMQDAPTDLGRAAHSVTKFAFVHPKTFAKFTGGAYSPKSSAPYIQIRPSPTKWVVTTLMPENQVIYTPNSLPGLEKLLSR